MKTRNLIPIKVICHSGYKADEYPVKFSDETTDFEVTEIIDRWYQSDRDPEWPESNYFKVLTTSGRRFILKHDLDNDLWFMLSGEF